MVNLDRRAHWPLYGSTSQHSEKNLRNDGESGCGWLNLNPKSPENNPKNAQTQQPTENQRNAKTEI